MQLKEIGNPRSVKEIEIEIDEGDRDRESEISEGDRDRLRRGLGFAIWGFRIFRVFFFFFLNSSGHIRVFQ